MPLFIYEFGKGALLFQKMWNESVLQNSSQWKGWKCKVEQYIKMEELKDRLQMIKSFCN